MSLDILELSGNVVNKVPLFIFLQRTKQRNRKWHAKIYHKVVVNGKHGILLSIVTRNNSVVDIYLYKIKYLCCVICKF